MMPDSTFMICPAESIPLPDTSVDLIFSTASFHHWSDQLQGIREIRRVLRSGGQFFLADVASPPFFLRFGHHGQIRNRYEIRKMFEQVGLEVQTQQRLLLGHFLVTSGYSTVTTGCISDENHLDSHIAQQHTRTRRTVLRPVLLDLLVTPRLLRSCRLP